MYTYCLLFSRMSIFYIEGKITNISFLQSVFNFKCNRVLKTFLSSCSFLW